MKRIVLTRGQFAIVDDEDYDALMLYAWTAFESSVGFYAQRSWRRDGKRGTIYMHREILGLVSGDRVKIDHVNHDTLDNRRENLAPGTDRANQENRVDQSEYGVGVQKLDSGRFQCTVRIKGRNTYLGMFDTPSEAVQARTEALEAPA